MRPFYSPQRGQMIVDAKCACGHAEREHGSALRTSGEDTIRLNHDGSCCGGEGCDCTCFTWAGWITVDEAGSKVRSRQPVCVH